MPEPNIPIVPVEPVPINEVTPQPGRREDGGAKIPLTDPKPKHPPVHTPAPPKPEK